MTIKLNKNLAIAILTLLVLCLFGYAWAKQGAQTDANQRVSWIAPYDVTTITADTTIDTSIIAIMPETDVNVYFGDDTTNDYLVKANTLFALNHRFAPKLKTNTVCLVY